MTMKHYPLFLAIYLLLTIQAIDKIAPIRELHEASGGVLPKTSFLEDSLFYSAGIGSAIAMFWTLGLLVKEADQEKWYSEGNIVFFLVLMIQLLIFYKLGFLIG